VELPPIFRYNFKDTYEDIMLNDKEEYSPPTDFIDMFITTI
jgi:hypothetical protein